MTTPPKDRRGGVRGSGTGPGQATRSVVQGLLLVGRGRAEGLAQFDSSVSGFLASLAPWVAFLIVAAILVGLQARPLGGLTNIMVAFCLLLMPPVLTERLASWWDRDSNWLSFVTATMWCKWLMPAIYAVGLAVASFAVKAGLPQNAAAGLLVGLISGYLLWLDFFLARAALSLTKIRAATLVATTLTSYLLLWEVARVSGNDVGQVLRF